MKKLFRVLIICLILLTSIGVVPGLADPNAPTKVYIPFMFRQGSTQVVTHTVSGMVRDADNYPVAGVLISDGKGATATTGLNGTYTIVVEQGPNTLTATRSGYDIAAQSVTVNADLNGVNFQAQVGCGNIVVNESIDVGMGGWDFSTDNDDIIAGTDTLFPANSVPSSGRTGVDVNSIPFLNEPSTNLARSQAYHLPTDADAVILGVWVYQINTGVALDEWDRQYIEILDDDGDLKRTLYYSSFTIPVLGWTYMEFPLDDLKGSSIKIQFRVMNDGETGYAAMYFDDVNLVICNTHCDSKVVNGGFELLPTVYPLSVTGWLARGPQNVLPAYTGTQFYRGAYSMRTGIPPTEDPADPLSNFYAIAFTEVYQTVDLRDSDYNDALLTFWIYRTRLYGVTPPVDPVPPAEFGPKNEVPVPGSLGYSPDVVTDTPEEDWIYVYIKDTSGNVLERLIWEKASDVRTWVRYEFDISEHLGRRVILEFGTYNDGRDGPSAMYIDNVVLGACE